MNNRHVLWRAAADVRCHLGKGILLLRGCLPVSDILAWRIGRTHWDCVCPAPCSVVITATPPCRAHHVCMERARRGQSGERGPGVVVELRPLSTSTCPETLCTSTHPHSRRRSWERRKRDVEQKETVRVLAGSG